MRHLLPAVLACLLLAGCGAPADTAAGVPEATSVEILSAPSIVTEGQAPGEDLDLPTAVVSLYDWQTSGEPLALLAEIPEQGMALYGAASGDASHVLFRWDDTLAEFPDWTIDAPKSVALELLALDLDGDGSVEPVVLCYQGGTQVNLYDLHVLQQSSGTLTDYRLPEALYEEQLSGLLTLGGSGETLTVSLGDQSIEAALPEGVQAETLDRLWTGANVSWLEAAGTLRLVDRPALLPEDAAAKAGIASAVFLPAEVSARVSFSDGRFTLSDMTLQSKFSEVFHKE